MTAHTSFSVDCTSLLGIVFVTLKLCGLIDWSWWLVTLPFWGLFAVVLVLGFSALLMVFWVVSILEWHDCRPNRYLATPADKNKETL